MGTTMGGAPGHDATSHADPSGRLAVDPTGLTSNSPDVVLEAEGVSKSFGGVAALVDVDFDLRAGEVRWSARTAPANRR